MDEFRIEVQGNVVYLMGPAGTVVYMAEDEADAQRAAFFFTQMAIKVVRVNAAMWN